MFVLYPNVVSWLHKKFATDQAIAEKGASFAVYKQPLDVASQQFADGTVSTLC